MSQAYAIVARDKPNMKATRMELLKDHLAHIETQLDRLLVAGPMRDADGAFVGSLLVLRADSVEDAAAFLERDPYFAAGIWAEVTISAFNAAAGQWVGGKTWQ
jgi:uncharacterized protein